LTVELTVCQEAVVGRAPSLFYYAPMAPDVRTWKLEFPYRRSVGPVIGAFLAGLRDRRVIGVRTAGGRVLVPPFEYDPDSGEATRETCEVGQTGTLERFAWAPIPPRNAPLDRPFAWAMVKLDGADTSLLHVLDVPSPDGLRVGMRVRVRWRDETTGHLTDIACFEPGEASTDHPVAANTAAANTVASSTASEPVQHMSQMVSVEYGVPEPTPLSRHFADRLRTGSIVGHKCPSCGKVYVPPRGYCGLCVVATTDRDEVEVADRGTLTTFSVITPIQYPGQEEHDDYVQATILLDGADSSVMMQRLEDIEIDEVHSGMRVEAVWATEGERSGEPDGGGRGMGFGDAIRAWRPSGEPDAALEQYAEHIL
jgi:hypothetical protein